MENLKLMVCFCRKILSVKRNLGKERMANNGRDGNGNEDFELLDFFTFFSDCKISCRKISSFWK